MTDKDYSKREIDDKLGTIMDFLQRIETQTTKTNGRVSKLERNLMILAAVFATVTVLKYQEVLTVVKLFL